LESEIAVLKETVFQEQKEADYHQFLLKELDEADFKIEEDIELESQLSILTHSETIKQQLFIASELLDAATPSVLMQLCDVKNALQGIASYSKYYEDLSQRLESDYLELKDLASDIAKYYEEIEVNPNELELVQQRLNELYRLEQKHKVSDLEFLLKTHNELKNRVHSASDRQVELSKAEEILKNLRLEMETIGEKLSLSRHQVKIPFEKEVKHLLQELNMPAAEFEISISTGDEYTAMGKDNLQFLFTANAGKRLIPLQDCASGGELSRLMLTLKTIVSKSLQMPTVIFDEIDTGISGQTASKVAFVLQRAATHIQLIAITHLPQIAAAGNAHFLVTKKTNPAVTEVTLLEMPERAQEIAVMLGGNMQSENALKTAQELLKISQS
jgi:DNA repair protein RecN (Recombination protein N)